MTQVNEARRNGRSTGTFEPAAYLSIVSTESGPKSAEHIGLVKGQRATLGRGDTCFIRVNDDRCSREHCMVFQNAGQWMLKDLSSRNGTLVDNKPVSSNHALRDQTIFQIGNTKVQFTLQLPPDDDPSSARSRRDTSAGSIRETELDIDQLDENLIALTDDAIADRLLTGGDSAVVAPGRPIEPRDSETIIERAQRSRLVESGGSVGEKDTEAVIRLLQVGSKIGQAKSIRSACRTALRILLEQTAAEFGAVLMLPSTKTADRDAAKLKMVAFESTTEQAYTRVSQSVSRVVFKEDLGVFFLDTAAEEELQNAESIGEMGLHSAICVPIRLHTRIAGLLHLYTKNTGEPLSDEDFHLTLALAELLSIAFAQLAEAKQAEQKVEKEKRDADSLRAQLADNSIGEIVGKSRSVVGLRESIARVAPTDATVLVRGESGVGKELVGRAMHFGSRRASGPFVTMNCAALTESLLESELFGHEKGAFTGATGKKKGKFEQADGGTLMLDEVGEMSLEIQAKFLRVLEGHPFERVGGAESVTTDVRVVAATNRDLEDAVREGTFRKDLYFRLHVIVITIDPLRHRVVDIDLLAQHFIERFAPKCGREVKGLSSEALQRLQRYRWPGNIRELQNTIERAVILSKGDLIEQDDIHFSALSSFEEVAKEPVAPVDDEPVETFREVTIETLEKKHILSTLEATEWNKTRAAQILGIERSTLDRKLKRYGVVRPES